MTGFERVPPLSLEDDDTGALAHRLRLTFAASIVPIVIFALFDLALVPRADLPMYWTIKLAALAVIVVATALLRERPGRPLRRRRLIAVGLGAVTVLFALSTTSAVLAGEGQASIILSLGVALGTATLLPWGVGPQVVVVLLGAASSATALWFATGTDVLQYPMVGLVIGLGVSIAIAREFDRSRRALAAQQAERAAAVREVQRLNAELERRVAERTVELERVNRALQDEIAERTRYATALRESQAAVAAVVENADDAIWAVDRNARLIVGNAALRRRLQELWGLTLRPDGQYGGRLQGAFEREWLPRYARALAGEHFSVEQTVGTGEAARTFVHAFNPIVTDGQVTGVAVFSSEITAQLRAEAAARRHQAELTHVQRLSTLGEMAGGIAHEINQPLAAIVNFACGCARRLRADPGAGAAVLPAIEDIATEALRAGEIIRRLRQLVRKEPPRHECFDLNACVGDALGLIGSEARQLGVEVRGALAAGLLPLRGDRIQIEQVALNLLRNAIEAMAEVEAPRELHVTTRALDATTVELVVSDTGPGLPAGPPDAVFEPFVSTKTAGLGMGLSISRTIVELHCGRLLAVPHSGRGVSFHVRLPVEPASADMVPAAAVG